MAPNFVTKDPTAIRIPSRDFVADRFSMAAENAGCNKPINDRKIGIILT